MIIATFFFVLTLAGCGGSSASTPTVLQPPNSALSNSSPSPLPSPSPTPTSSASKLAACGTKNGSTSTITGKVVDVNTQQPINGEVLVWIDFPNGTGVDLLKAAPDGSFTSDQLVLAQNSFALVFAAISASGVYYQPIILLPTSTCNIGQGTDIGTIALAPGSGSATLTAMATATTAQNQPALVDAQAALFEQAAGVNWAIPWGTVWPPPRTALAVSSSCPANTACTTFTTAASSSPALSGSYAGPSTSFLPVGSQPSYLMQISWEPGSTFTGACTPTMVQLGPMAATPGSTLNFGTASFIGC